MSETTYAVRRTTVARTTHYEVADAPDMPVKYTSQTMRPYAATVSSTDGTVQKVTVHGHRVIKSGDVGQSIHTVDFYSGRWAEEMPEWVGSIVRSHSAEYGADR